MSQVYTFSVAVQEVAASAQGTNGQKAPYSIEQRVVGRSLVLCMFIGADASKLCLTTCRDIDVSVSTPLQHMAWHQPIGIAWSMKLSCIDWLPGMPA